MTREWSRREALGFSAAAALALGAGAQSAPQVALQGMSALGRGSFDPSNLNRLVQDLLPRSGTPGLSVAVIRDNRIAYLRGYGVADRATGRPVTPQTIFQAASLTKPLFAYLVMKLSERGELGLDVPLTIHAPASLISNDSRAARITARNALTHSSGLPNWTGGRRPMELRFAPGESFAYSSEGYLYLQQAVERLTGQPLRNLMEERVLAPLGLLDSSVVWNGACESRAAVGYEWDGAPVTAPSKPTEAGAASTLHTTAGDYAKFMCELLTHPPTDAYRLDYMSERMMLSPQVRLDTGLAWGLGWGLHLHDDGDRFWHWGDSRGFMNLAVGSRIEKSGVVIFTNGRHGLRLAHRVAEQVMGGQDPIFSWIYEVFYEGKLPEWPAPAPAPPPRKEAVPRRRRRREK